MMEITKDLLIELFYYVDDCLIWKFRNIQYFSHCKNPNQACSVWNSQNAGKIAGNEFSDGKTKYIQISISIGGNTKRYLAHRLIWLYVTGELPNKVDHIDGDGLNNSISNLRSVDTIDNNKNQKMSKKNTSGFTGVTYDKRNEKWKAFITVNGKTINGGLFININDAISKRKSLNIEYGFHTLHGRK